MANRLATACILVALALRAAPAIPQPAALPTIATITFAPGSTLSTVDGRMVPGCCDLYYVPAKAGQTLLVSVAAKGEVTFRVFRPETTVAKAADGKLQFAGTTLPEAGADDNAKAWVGALPQGGKYLIAVAMADRGTMLSPYTLTVSLQ